MIYECDDMGPDIKCRPMSEEQRRLENEIRSRALPDPTLWEWIREWLMR